MTAWLTEAAEACVDAAQTYHIQADLYAAGRRKRRRQAKALEHSAHVLRLLATAPDGMTAAEIREKCG